MSHRLLSRLLAAFGVVILVVIAIVFVIANQTTNNEFRAYMYRGGMLPSSQFARDLATYYSARGSWQDVDSYFAQASDTGMGNRGMTRGMPMMGAPVLLADASGIVVASRDGAGIGQRVSSAQLAQGIAIEVDGQAVGTVIFPAASPMFDQAQQEFLSRVNVSILIAGIAAGVIAFILGFILVFQITAPLDALARAAQKIARGDLTARVAQPSADEIGQVSRAFNAMADSLAQSETARRNMIADIAHELRNPLGVLRGQLEGMMDGVFPTTPEQLASLHEETLLLARLVEDLRELALADAGQLQINRAPSDLGALIEKTVATFAPHAREKQIALQTDLARDLPRVTIDDQRIEQVLRNLIGNALRHTPADGAVSVRGSIERDGFVRVSVADTGEGIAAEDLPSVFDRFYRGDKSRSRAGGGAGLGLAIARQLVRAHNGAIGVESEPGRGAMFWFTLPI